jgi:hypothetical protein
MSGAARVPREQWDGLPGVSADYAAGRDAISGRVKRLVDSLLVVQSARGRRRRP